MFIKHINEYDNILPHVCISPSVSGGRCLDGCLFVDSLDGYFFTSRANGSARAIINQNIELDSFCLSPTDALIIAKTALWQFYDINDIEACNPYTISEDDSTYYVRGSLEHLPNHLTGKSHYSREELKEVSSIIRNREIYNVRIIILISNSNTFCIISRTIIRNHYFDFIKPFLVNKCSKTLI